jgi:hypothetical protein
MPLSRRFRWLWLALLWAAIVAASLEIGLRLAAALLPARLGATARWVMTGQPYAEDWTPAWQENIDHYYALRPGLDNVLQYGSPTVSFHLSTIELWEGGGIGFRARPVDYFVDAVVVGDSFGMCFTELADCWVTILEQQTRMGMVNLSQPVTGATSHARILKAFGEPLRPPLVIWQFFGNDFNEDYGLAVYGEIEVGDPPRIPGATPLDWLGPVACRAETALTDVVGLPTRSRFSPHTAPATASMCCAAGFMSSASSPSAEPDRAGLIPAGAGRVPRFGGNLGRETGRGAHPCARGSLRAHYRPADGPGCHDRITQRPRGHARPVRRTRPVVS